MRSEHRGSKIEMENSKKSTDNVWQWLVEASEDAVSQVAGEVLSNPHLADAVEAALKRAAQTKGQVNRNLERLLGALNVVTTSDHQALVRKVEALQGSLVNVNMKLDRLLAEHETRKRAAPRRAPNADS